MPLRRVLSGLSNFVLSTFSDVGSIPLTRGGSNCKSGTRFYALTRIEKVHLEEVRLRRSSDVGRRSRDLFGTVKGLASPSTSHFRFYFAITRASDRKSTRLNSSHVPI